MDGYRNGYNGADLKSDVAKALWVRILHHPPVAHYYFRIGIYDYEYGTIGEFYYNKILRESSLVFGQNEKGVNMWTIHMA